MPGPARRVSIGGPPRARTRVAHRARSYDSEPSRPAAARFPITRHGYDPAIVDRQFAELERERAELERELIALDREIAQLQVRTPPSVDAGSEIERIGEQVSAILIAAHESAGETVRLAQAEVEHRIAEAELAAQAIIERSHDDLKELREETAALRDERERLRGDIRRLADGLHALADGPLKELPAGSAD